MKFTLEQNHKAELEKLANSGMTPVVIAQRAKILLMKADGKSATAIADELGVSRHTAELWIKKYRSRSKEDSIEDLLNVDKGRGRKEEITGEAKTWLISIACTQPKDYGYAAETWTTKALTRHINKTAVDAGFDRLATITESGVYRILDKCKIKPFRIAEQYLIAAEGYAMAGQADQACTYLNLLRASRIPGYADRHYSGDELMAQIKLERARELYGEGFRFKDLKRWASHAARRRTRTW